MNAHEPVFAGYLPKVVYEPDWNIIKQVASVSGCQSEGPVPKEDSLAYWQYNRAFFYPTVALALAVAEPGAAIFGYWIYPVLFDGAEGPRPIDLNAMFDSNDTSLPAESPSPPWWVLGYDAVAFETEYRCWGCSPLTCNGYATDEDGPRPVNRYGLLRTPEAAFEAALLFQAEQPEPGTYLVFRVEVPPESPLLSLEP
ncbi:hypothetical protein EON79_20370 [bacterium]|nr:MAG: hypothetical protein EON79_20370 [bacterium]